ncbi:MAG: hypothetical protein U9Q66_03660, partial [Patescibacteria group bacterium]|nr:hypothetical protein [Patescibacteria group bacterium]
LGPTLKQWRRGWGQRLTQKPEELNIPLPSGKMTPAGYIKGVAKITENLNKNIYLMQKSRYNGCK